MKKIFTKDLRKLKKSDSRFHQQGIGSYFLKCIQLDPEAYIAEWESAGIFYKLGKLDHAIAHYGRFVDLEPVRLKSDPASEKAITKIAMNNIGLLYLENKHYDKALVWFEKVLEKDPSNKTALINLGITLNHLKR